MYLFLLLCSDEAVPQLLSRALSGADNEDRAVAVKSNDHDLSSLDIDFLLPASSTPKTMTSTTTPSPSTTLSSSTFRKLPMTSDSLPEVTYVSHKSRVGGFFLPRRTRPVPAPEEEIKNKPWYPNPDESLIFDLDGFLAEKGPNSAEGEANDN